MLRIIDWMLIHSLLERAHQGARLDKQPAPVLQAYEETLRRVQNAKLRAPEPVQVEFQERFHRNECRALRVGMGYARKWLERDGGQLDAATASGFDALTEKLHRYIEEMDSFAEMKLWHVEPKSVPQILLPNDPKKA